MGIYVVLYWFEIIIGLLFEKKGYAQKPAIRISHNKIRVDIKSFLIMIVMFLPLFSIMGFRNGIGADFNNYKRIYSTARDGWGNYYNVEIGYWILNRILGFFFKNEQCIFIVTAFITVWAYMKGFLSTSRKIVVPLATFMGVGYYFYAMNITRQYLAISIVCLAYHFLEEEKYLNFWGAVAFAALFHQSILIWIPVYFLIRFVQGKVFYIASLIFAVVFRVGIQYIILFLENYTSYAHFFVADSKFVQSRTSIWNILISGTVFLAGILFKKNILKVNKHNENRLKLIWIMLIGYIGFSILGDSMVRLVLNFSFLIPMVLSDFFEGFNRSFSRFYKCLYVVLMFGLMVFILTYSGNASNHFVPYVSFFDENIR